MESDGGLGSRYLHELRICENALFVDQGFFLDANLHVHFRGTLVCTGDEVGLNWLRKPCKDMKAQ